MTTNTKNYWAYDESLLDEIPKEVKIIRASEFDPFYLQIMLSKIGLGKLYQKIKDRFFIPDEKIGWIPFAYHKGVKELTTRKYDLIFSTSPTPCAHIIALKLNKRFGIPWICDFRDFWTRHPYYKYKNQKRESKETKLEDSFIYNADRTTCAFNSIIQKWSSNFIKLIERNIHVIYNGFDDDQTPKEKSKKDSLYLTITYTGSFYGAYNPYHFLEALKQLKDGNEEIIDRIRIQFIGNIEENIKIRVNEYKLGIIIKTFIPQSDLLAEIEYTDLLLLIMPDNSQLPGKVFSYMAIYKPIFAIIPDSEIKTILKKSNLGFFADPSSLNSIKNELLRIYNLWNNNKLQVNPNFDYIQQFHRRNLTKQLVSVFNTVVSNNKTKK
ncbi:MAG: glycosyltransferase [Bacteroidota bacterium]